MTGVQPGEGGQGFRAITNAGEAGVQGWAGVLRLLAADKWQAIAAWLHIQADRIHPGPIGYEHMEKLRKNGQAYGWPR